MPCPSAQGRGNIGFKVETVARAQEIIAPFADDVVASLHTGDKVLITGVIYTARDAAHKRLIELIDKGEKLPFDLQGQVIYYVGPTPPKPGMPIGSAGPTTSGRMDVYTPSLIERGLKGMIGKGQRSQAVKDAMIKYKAVYFGATGGAGALLSKRIIKSEVIAFEDLGPEAIRRLEVEDFPAVVINDIYRKDLYDEGVKRFAR
jgi:fumarate hydratase subunit beta